MKVKLGRAYSDGEIFKNSILEIENGRFAGFSDGDDADIDLSSYIAFPGFIDMHTHGAIGIEANTASFEEFDSLSRFYASNGVSEFCVTTVTDSAERLEEIEKLIAKRIKAGTSGANIAGIYLEGPFLSRKLRGAHDEALLASPDKSVIDRLIAAADGHLRVLAIAPETEGALDAIAYAMAKGIKVACGHSAATCAEASSAFNAGASIAIHTYNCMSPLHHREPGVVGASLVNDSVYNEIICDFIHVAPEAVKVAYRCKGKDRIVFITDSIGAAGLPDGEYKFGPLTTFVKDGVARIAEGNLAGSSLRTNVALGNVVRELKIPLADAMLGVTKNPAKALGIYDEIGSFACGKRAHFTALDEDFNVIMTAVDGKIVYKA